MEQLILESARIFTFVCVLPLLCTTCCSLVVAFLQTITQNQEQSLLFLVKLIAIIVLLCFEGTTITELLQAFTISTFEMLGRS
jgi:type III secretory pathway component EscS